MALDHQKMDRLSIWMISIIGVIIFFGGVLQIRSHLYTADRTLFAVARQIAQEAEDAAALSQNTLDPESPEEKSLAQLQSEDTDADGLSDFDELYVYTTSPYLTDSDSDGESDSAELAAGEDPNCPIGEPCEQQRTAGSQTQTEAEAAFSSFNPDQLAPTDEEGNVDTVAMREMLAAQGVPQELLDQTKDEDLLVVFNEAAALIDQGGNAIVNVQEEAQQIKDLSTLDKRAFLLQTGLAQADIDTMTDEEVEQVVNESVDEAVNDVLQQDIGPATE